MKMFNYSDLQFSEVTSFKIHTLVIMITNFVSGVSKEKFGGTVRHSSPACRNLMTSPPKTQETFFTLDKPVPKGEIIQWVTWKEAFTIALSSSFVACWKKRKKASGNVF